MQDFAPTETDIRFAQNEVAKLMADYDDDRLLRLCAEHSRGVLPVLATAAEAVRDEIIARLSTHTPWSMIRVGEGEGSVVGLRASSEPERQIQLSYFDARMRRDHRAVFDPDQRAWFGDQFLASLMGADVLGFRSLDRGRLPPESEVIDRTLHANSIGVVLGMISARQFLEREIARGSFRDKLLTSAWMHLGLIPYLGELLEAAEAITVINGNAELADAFRQRAGRRPCTFITIPSQGAGGHFPAVFHDVIDALERGSRGTLVLIGAGILGKLYCSAAKRGGGVAVDMGSAFDLLANKVTRLAHRQFDVEKFRWI